MESSSAKVFRWLREDHAKINELLCLVKSSPAHLKPQTLVELTQLVRRSISIEESLLYGYLEEKLNGFEIAAEAVAQHEILGELLQRVTNHPAYRPEWIQSVEELRIKFESHSRWEQKELFGVMEEIFNPTEFDDLLERYQKIRDEKNVTA